MPSPIKDKVDFRKSHSPKTGEVLDKIFADVIADLRVLGNIVLYGQEELDEHIDYFIDKYEEWRKQI